MGRRARRRAIRLESESAPRPTLQLVDIIFIAPFIGAFFLTMKAIFDIRIAMDCIFCKIANKEIPSEIVSEDENFVVFKDIHPKAPVHLLIIRKWHVGPVSALGEADKKVAGDIILKAKETAEKIGVSENGYRLIFNIGKDAGMEVDHLHLHFLAGVLLEF